MPAWVLAIALIAGCHGEAPSQSAAKPAAHVAASKAAAQDAAKPEPPDAHAVALHKPAQEPLPEPVAIPKKKFKDALRLAQVALDSGKPDERVVPVGQAPAELNDMIAPAAPTGSLPTDALALYRGVLVTDPDNAAALHGMDAVVAALHARALSSLGRDDIVDAQRDADRLQLLRPDDPGLPALKAALDKGWRVAALVARGRQLERAGALIAPRSANAAAVYRRALAIEPGSMSADAGLARVEGVFIARAMAEAQASRFPQSDRLIAQAASVRADSQALQDASARIVEIRQRHAAVLEAQANTALAMGDPDRAERLLHQIERAAPLSPESSDLRERIRLTRNYGMFRPGQAFTEALASAGRAPEMIVLPIGSFRMGSTDADAGHDANESPQREIRFGHGFAMARTEITVDQFARFVQATHYRTDAERNGHSMVYDEAKGKLDERAGVSWRDDHTGKPADPQEPVLHVSWNDAQAYTVWLSKETSHLYRLPSEAEFEYALRAGSNSAYPWPGTKPPADVGDLAGSDPSPSGRRWGDAFAGYSDGYWGPAPAGHFAANAFGLYDMVGNVAEWTQDCWHDSYRRAPSDGSAWVNPGCAQRVVRGASWASAPPQSRSAYRAPADADSGNARVGFRVVREL